MICGKSSTSQSLLWIPGYHRFSLSPQTLLTFCQWIHSVFIPSMSAQTHSLIFLYENKDLMIYGNFLRCHVVHSIYCLLEGEKCKAEGKAAKELKRSQIIKESRSYPASLSLGWAFMEKCLSILWHLDSNCFLGNSIILISLSGTISAFPTIQVPYLRNSGWISPWITRQLILREFCLWNQA